MDSVSLGEAARTIGVIVTVGYLAVQIRQNTLAIRTSAYDNATASLNNFLGWLGQSESALDTLAKGAEGLDTLDKRENLQFSTMMNSIFTVIENLYHQHRYGRIDDKFWMKWDRWTQLYLLSPGIAQWWELQREIFTEEFAAYVDTTLAGLRDGSITGPVASRSYHREISDDTVARTGAPD